SSHSGQSGHSGYLFSVQVSFRLNLKKSIQIRSGQTEYTPVQVNSDQVIFQDNLKPEQVNLNCSKPYPYISIGLTMDLYNQYRTSGLRPHFFPKVERHCQNIKLLNAN